MIIGYTCGVYDLLHEGHINILKKSKSLCDKLIVGLSTDECVKYKFKNTVMNYESRKKILESIKYVDAVIPQEDTNKILAWNKIKFDYLFVGDDWYNTEKWNNLEEKFKELNVKIMYFPYTQSCSTTIIKKKILNPNNIMILFDLDKTLWNFYTNLITNEEFDEKIKTFKFNDDIIRIFNYLRINNINFGFVSRSKYKDRCKQLLSKLNVNLDNQLHCIKYTPEKSKYFHCAEIIKNSSISPEFMILFDDDKENIDSVKGLIQKGVVVDKDNLLTFENFINGLF